MRDEIDLGNQHCRLRQQAQGGALRKDPWLAAYVRRVDPPS